MKKQLVIIAGSCYPVASANGNIALSCAEYLKDEYEISLVSVKHYKNKKTIMPFENGTMYFVGHIRHSLYQKMNDLFKEKKGVEKKIAWFFLNFIRLIGYIEGKFFFLDNMWWFKKKVQKTLYRINDKQKIDAILSINMPVESHLAAQNFKKSHENVFWASYFADPIIYSSKKKNLFISNEKICKMIRGILKESSVVFTTEEIFDMLATEYSCEKEKLVSVPYALNESGLNLCSIKNSSSSKRILYMGTFYKTIRNPEYMLKVFSELSAEAVVLDLYITGDCFDIVDKYAKLSGGKIKVHERVPKKELYRIIEQVDCVINLDNENCQGKPSKLYELMSFRKPIIYFSSFESTELDKYPNKLFLNTKDDVKNSAEKLKNFIFSNRFSAISSEELREIFPNHTESYIKNLIRKKFDLDNIFSEANER